MSKKKVKIPAKKGEIEVKVNSGPITGTEIDDGKTTVKEVLLKKIKTLKWRIYRNGVEVTSTKEKLADGDFLLISGEVQ